MSDNEDNNIIKDYGLIIETISKMMKKPLRKFIQIDFFQDIEPGDVMSSDEDKDVICAGETYELRNLNELRILIPDGYKAKDAIRGLKKAVKWLKKDPNILTHNAFTIEKAGAEGGRGEATMRYLESESKRLKDLREEIILALYNPDAETLRKARKSIDDYRELPF